MLRQTTWPLRSGLPLRLQREHATGIRRLARGSSGAGAPPTETRALALGRKRARDALRSARRRSRVDARQMVGVTRKEVYAAPGRAAPARL
jgi:hypothetical protein